MCVWVGFVVRSMGLTFGFVLFAEIATKAIVEKKNPFQVIREFHPPPTTRTTTTTTTTTQNANQKDIKDKPETRECNVIRRSRIPPVLSLFRS